MANSTLDFLEKGKVLEIPSDTKYWLVRADGGKYYTDFLLNNFIAVSDNEITLEDTEGQLRLDIELETSLESYKSLYKEKYFKWNNQQIAHAASRTMKFIEEIQVNDIVIVPSHRSNYFILGIILGDPYEVSEINVDAFVPDDYPICPYKKRRKVLWIKEVPRNAISEKMYWILSTHQSILALDIHSEYIDKLLAPIYVKNNYCYSTLKVDKKEGVTSSEWFKFYGVIEQLKEESSEVIVKSNVESPGYIELISELSALPRNIAMTVALSGLLFGKINLFGIETQGIIPYFFGNGKLEREKKKLENEGLKLENELKRIDIVRAKEDSGLPPESFNEKKLTKEKAETIALELSRELKISAFNAGKILEHRKKMDADHSQDVGEPEQK